MLSKHSILIKRFFVFLVFNFSALALGSAFTQKGVSSAWYQSLQKAPWTPPGWVFGFAWTLIMLCFALYMAKLWEEKGGRKKLAFLFSLQWILNVAWNPSFFYFHNAMLGFFLILALTILIAYFFFHYLSKTKSYALFVLPYLLWLIIATSLNAYILVFN